MLICHCANMPVQVNGYSSAARLLLPTCPNSVFTFSCVETVCKSPKSQASKCGIYSRLSILASTFSRDYCTLQVHLQRDSGQKAFKMSQFTFRQHQQVGWAPSPQIFGLLPVQVQANEFRFRNRHPHPPQWKKNHKQTTKKLCERGWLLTCCCRLEYKYSVCLGTLQDLTFKENFLQNMQAFMFAFLRVFLLIQSVRGKQVVLMCHETTFERITSLKMQMLSLHRRKNIVQN